MNYYIERWFYKNNKSIYEKELEKLKELSKFLVYDHVERNGNHFSYYFSTEKLWDFPDIRKNVQEWLEEKKDLFPAVECKVYRRRTRIVLGTESVIFIFALLFKWEITIRSVCMAFSMVAISLLTGTVELAISNKIKRFD